jgi:alpha-L-fucosidase
VNYLCAGYFLYRLLKVYAQSKINPKTIQEKQWFADAKLGIFIHADIYAMNGIDESWSFHTKKSVMPAT